MCNAGRCNPETCKESERRLARPVALVKITCLEVFSGLRPQLIQNAASMSRFILGLSVLRLLLHIFVGVLCVSFGLARTPAPSRPEFPGPPCGDAAVIQGKGQFGLRNDALAITWSLDTAGIRLSRITDLRLGRVVEYTGELFVVRLADGTAYAASQFKTEGEPRVTRVRPMPNAAGFSQALPGRQVEVHLRSRDDLFSVTWRAILHDGESYVRQVVDICSKSGCQVAALAWMTEPLPEASVMGSVDGSPAVAGSFYYAIENPNAACQALPLLPRNAPLRKDETWTVSFVIGVSPPGQLRRAFLFYIERERAHPYRPFLHYNSWYDIAWEPFALNEANCLEAVRLWGERFIKPYGVVMDALVFDDGWDDPNSLWAFHRGFPNGFAPLARAAREYQTHLGVWLSPFGGYGEPKNRRLEFGAEQGFETNRAGFSLAGPKYYEAFKKSCLRMMREYGVNHFKFDGIANGMYANGSAEYLFDTEAMRRLMVELRREDPDVFINLTTGSWPSPFWLRFADSLWRQGDDMGLSGKGSKQQQWITYRDQEVFRNIVGKGPLFPLNSLMNQGVAYSRQGTAGNPSFNSAGFKEDVLSFFGSGTSLQELYVQADKLNSADWEILAQAAKWSRQHADVLADVHWVGGDPSKGQVYGYAAWNRRKGIVTLRNPDDRAQEYRLVPATAFELPVKYLQKFRLSAPFYSSFEGNGRAIGSNEGIPVHLAPFEILILEAAPVH